jgi:hypothetical protein
VVPRYQYSKEKVLFYPKDGHNVLLKCWYLSTKLHSVTSQETATFMATAVINPNPTKCMHYFRSTEAKKEPDNFNTTMFTANKLLETGKL